MKTTINKSKVMSRAWQIAKCVARRTGSKVRTTSYTFSEAMRQAWKEAKTAIVKAIREAEMAADKAAIRMRGAESADNYSFMSGCAEYYAAGINGRTYFGD